jgi:hypothetical protein
LKICFEDKNTVTEELTNCLVEKLHQEFTFSCLCENAFSIKWSTKRDSLFIVRRVGKSLSVETYGFDMLPSKWLVQIKKNPKTGVNKLNSNLKRMGYSSIGGYLMRPSNSSDDLILVMQKSSLPSSIDAMVGFGSGNEFSVYGQGDIELVDLFTNFSTSIIKFERLAVRNSQIFIDHSQLKPIGFIGPNRLHFSALQRDSLFRKSHFSLVKYPPQHFLKFLA